MNKEQNNFKKNKYLILKNVISTETSDYFFQYLKLKKQVCETLLKEKYISPYEEMHGIFGDTQIQNTFAMYGDALMETLLLKLLPIMESSTKLKLTSNYAYVRLYKKGDMLARHKDRFSCEISTTVNLGVDQWPIFLEPNKNVGVPNGKNITMVSSNKGIKVILNKGDMLIYRGRELEHWREPFSGNECGQVFLHYNDVKNKEAKNNIFDSRPHLGLPAWFQKNVLL
jgi:ribosomal protein S8